MSLSCKPLCLLWFGLYVLALSVFAHRWNGMGTVLCYFAYVIVVVSVPRLLGKKKWLQINQRLWRNRA
jgi:steroid 5-alpha reductase family enzyme